MGVARPYWAGDKKGTAWGLMALLIALMVCETQLAVMLIDKTGEMTSALAAKQADRFWAAVITSLVVLGFAVPVYAIYYYMRDAFSNHWRRWLTHRFLDGYLSERKYYEIGAGGDIDNPDQRISEDINTFTSRSTHFLLVFISSLMQLVAFSAVLWSISRTLVAFLAVYALLGTFGALYWFGAPLIRLNFWQIRREADFRFGLMRLRENAESIAFYRGEAQERVQIDHRFEAVFTNFARLIKKQLSLNLYQRSFSQLTLILPSIILANAVLSGELEVGRAIQAAGAFAAVLGAISLIVDNFESLSRFVAGIDRLHTLSQVVLKTPAAPTPWAEPGTTAGKTADVAPVPAISTEPLKPSPQIITRIGDTLVIEGLSLYTPQFGRLLVADLSLQLQPGDALLITGPSGCGKSSLLRAIAGLWRTGSGTVQHPPLGDMFFLPQRPYMQIDTLRSQIIYPSKQTTLSDERLLELLQEVHLESLAERVGGLNASHDWEKLLSVGEQQRLAFARVLARQPSIVILDEATSALDSANETALYERLRASGTTLISIAHRPAVLKHHTRVLEFKGEGAWELHAAADFRFDR
ncbi:ABC transporter ATP-binding protein/permease [Acidovorax sp.]|uniref:ABC transporter ATP-binding protein/permease n=1 Tax=Acidovorax sp. TaxID=1872122 RepID=UPI0025BC0046|nr:ABC transporter ATP-binding protein/permease [Acidovorax sp.]MBL7087305.1 ABC transporter ATP-binding protein/permease [Acidovorax sp.]